MRIVNFILIVLLIGFSSCRSGEYYKWNSTGPIQVLANDKELWMFLEVDTQVRHPGGFGCDHPRVYPVGHLQEILIFDHNGLKERLPVAMQNNICGTSFHPNLSRIFRMDDTFFLFSGSSADTRAALYKWGKDHFIIKSVDESDKFYQKYKPSYFCGQRSDSLDKITEDNNWRYLFSDSSFGGEKEFSWNDIIVKTKFMKEDEMSFQIQIDLNSDKKNISSTRISYQKDQKKLSYKEYSNLPREDFGHDK